MTHLHKTIFSISWWHKQLKQVWLEKITVQRVKL